MNLQEWTRLQEPLSRQVQLAGRCLISRIFFLSLNSRYLNFLSINEFLCEMLVDFPTIIYFEMENWCLVNGQLMTNYPGMELVPCEWAACGPVMELVLVVQL